MTAGDNQAASTDGGEAARRLVLVSGAQTGVDRAALDSALAHRVDCGGWCPEGRRAEDGVIPDRYPVSELAGGGYAERTFKNVEDSDGSVIIYFARAEGGTAKTLQYCLDLGKPHLLLDAETTGGAIADARIAEFYRQLDGGRLNFAGPRASGEGRAYAWTREAVDAFLERLGVEARAPV